MNKNLKTGIWKKQVSETGQFINGKTYSRMIFKEGVLEE
jgi:hypothetical protein